MKSKNSYKGIDPIIVRYVKYYAKRIKHLKCFAHESVEDIEQELLCMIWPTLEQYDESRGSFSTFVCQLVRSRALNLISRQSCQKRGGKEGISYVDPEALENMIDEKYHFSDEVADRIDVVKFGKREWYQSKREKRKTNSFNFLGFTHYCGKSRNGKLMMKQKTSKMSRARKSKEIKEWLKAIRDYVRLKDWWQKLKAKLIGHYNYFGVSGNYRCIKRFYWSVRKLTFKWINRRSQRKSMNWEQFVHYIQVNPLPKPKNMFFFI